MTARMQALCDRSIKELASRKKAKGSNIKSYIAHRQVELMQKQKHKQGYKYRIGGQV